MTETLTLKTKKLLPGAWANVAFPFIPQFSIISVHFNYPARLILYTSEDKRYKDAERSFAIVPDREIVLAQFNSCFGVTDLDHRTPERYRFHNPPYVFPSWFPLEIKQAGQIFAAVESRCGFKKDKFNIEVKLIIERIK